MVNLCEERLSFAWLSPSGMMSVMKKMIIQVRIYKGDKYFVAECFDLPVVTQAATLDELTENLKEAISLQLEGEDPADFGLTESPSILASFEVGPLEHAQT